MTEIFDENWKVIIDGKVVSKEELFDAYRKMQKLTLKGGETECPLCGCDFADNYIFVCDRCKRIMCEDDRCEYHAHRERNLCVDCCEKCNAEKGEQ